MLTNRQGVCAALGALLLTACSGGGSGSSLPSNLPAFQAATFSNPAQVTNAHFSLEPGTVRTFVEEDPDESVVIVEEVLDETRVVLGVTCVVVHVQEFEDELLVEDTRDWYAQDDDGNVWYMGEESTAYEYDEDDEISDSDTEGSWEAGMDVAGAGSIAEPGYYMEAAPAPGDTYNQEYYEEEAEDMGYIVATDADVELEDGTLYAGCLQTLDWIPLDAGALEYKFYAPGVGLVLEVDLVEDARVELTDIDS